VAGLAPLELGEGDRRPPARASSPQANRPSAEVGVRRALKGKGEAAPTPAIRSDNCYLRQQPEAKWFEFDNGGKQPLLPEATKLARIRRELPAAGRQVQGF
jgi:hypothetical protein